MFRVAALMTTRSFAYCIERIPCTSQRLLSQNGAVDALGINLCKRRFQQPTGNPFRRACDAKKLAGSYHVHLQERVYHTPKLTRRVTTDRLVIPVTPS